MRRRFLLCAVLLAGCFSVERPTAQRAPSPTTQVRGDYDAERLARLVLEYSNQARRTHGLGILLPDPGLTRAARSHSTDLAWSGLAAHTGSDGSAPADRVERAGVTYQALGENVFRGPLYLRRMITTGPDGTRESFEWATHEGLAEEAVQAWMDSPGHRANLLQPNFDRAGVGVAFDAELRWLLTLDLAR